MGQVKQQIMEEEDKFWNDCLDKMKDSECIEEFWRKYNDAEKDGRIKRPEHISRKEFEEDTDEVWTELWSKYYGH